MDESNDDNDIVLELAKAAGLPTQRFPNTNQEADLIEDFLAKEMEKLSMDEHEKIIFDVHGFVDFEEEDPAAVELKLKEFDNELTRIQDKEAYLLAKKLNETYVSNRKFRLMFLRRSLFDAKAAAANIVKHFEVKRRLFGSGEILVRNVRQSDLCTKSRELLESGYCQILPSRDTAGRTVVMACTNASQFRSPEWMGEVNHKAMWYLGMILLRDADTQKKGIVWIAMQSNDFMLSPEQFREMQDVERGIPYRVAGGHFCYTDPSLRPLAAGFQLFAGSNERNRMRIHCGTREEIDFKLQTFGIQTQDIKIHVDGTIDPTAHREFLATLRLQEEAEVDRKSDDDEANEDDIIVPGRFDVLFGKNRFAKEHTGTKRALHIVEMEFDAYEQLSKFQKADVVDRIISIIHESGGRFLRQNEAKAWVVADDEDAKKKIGHWFRHARSKRAGSQNKLETSEKSSTSGLTRIGRSVPKRIAEVVAAESYQSIFSVEGKGHELQSKKLMHT